LCSKVTPVNPNSVKIIAVLPPSTLYKDAGVRPLPSSIPNPNRNDPTISPILIGDIAGVGKAPKKLVQK